MVLGGAHGHAGRPAVHDQAAHPSSQRLCYARSVRSLGRVGMHGSGEAARQPGQRSQQLGDVVVGDEQAGRAEAFHGEFIDVCSEVC